MCVVSVSKATGINRACFLGAPFSLKVLGKKILFISKTNVYTIEWNQTLKSVLEIRHTTSNRFAWGPA